MEISLRCACGQQFIASEGMAGTSIACNCGNSVRVPSLTEMRMRSTEFVEVPSLAITSQQRQRQLGAALLYGCVLAGIALAALPLLVILFIHGTPMALVGALLILAGHAWFFTQIFTGNPTAALVVLLVPVVGEFLAWKFIFDYWSIARWPLLCQCTGVLLLLLGLARL
jgi:hypothetical protein